MSRELEITYRIPDDFNNDLNKQYEKADNAYNKLISSEFDMTGWIDPFAEMPDELINSIKEMAKQIRCKYTALVIVGIGGSYLGTQAALDYIKTDMTNDIPKIYYAGINLSSDYHEGILEQIENEDSALLIVSKSGSTTETLVAGNLFMEYIENKYGKDEKKDRVFIVTDAQNGQLRKLINEEGYASLPVPGDIGGRFSVLTAVGLLPMAIAGFDIDKILKGALSARDLSMIDEAKKMAAVRNLLEEKNYFMELFAGFDPYIASLIKWLKQLYGESEGKDSKGMYPVGLEYTTDLHSFGQFIQEGRQFFSETFIHVGDKPGNINIPTSWEISNRDMLLTELDDIAMKGVIMAHHSAGIPITQIEIPGRTEYDFGQIIYFFQMSCSIRGIMMGVNPFDQPGVEKYKSEVKKILK